MHIPQDVRRQTTKRKIVDAAVSLLSTSDYHQITSKDIAREAGISTGSFYTYFDNKKDILVEILKEYVLNAHISPDEPVPVQTNSLPGTELLLRTIVKRCFALHDFPPGFSKNILMVSLSDPDVQRIYGEYEKAMIGDIQKVVRSRIPNMGQSRLEAAGIVIYSAVKGSIHSIKFNQPSIDESVLVDELITLLQSYFNSFS